MDKEEIALIRRIRYGQIDAKELTALYYDHAGNYRIQFNLLQHPSFSERLALNVIPRLYTIDLIRLVKNPRTNPFIRKRAEMEFVNKYPRYPLGEKLGYMRIAPLTLLNHFIAERDKRILEVMLQNPQCTETLLMKMINREDHNDAKAALYEILVESDWLKRRTIAEAVSYDIDAPIRALLLVLPYLSLENLDRLFSSDQTHRAVKNGITEYLNKRVKGQGRL